MRTWLSARPALLTRGGVVLAGAGAVAVFALLGGSSAAGGGKPTGTLTPRGCIDDNDTGGDNCAKSTDGLAAASAIATSPDGKSVYVVSEGEGALAAFQRVKSGALTPNGCIVDDDALSPDTCAKTSQGLGGAGSVAVSSDGKSVYVASEGDSAISIFKRNRRNGQLKPKGCVTDSLAPGDNCTPTADGLDGASWVTVTGDGKSVYATGSSAIVRFSRNRKTGALKPKGCVEDSDGGPGVCAQTTPGLVTVGAVVASDDGRSVYASTETGTVVILKRDAKTGALSPKGCIVDHDVVAPPPACAQTTAGLDHAEALAVSHDGTSVYAVSGDDSAIVRFDRNPKSGALKPRGCIDDNDTGPDTCSKSTNGMNEGGSVVVSRDGKSVYYGSGQDDAVVTFKRTASGALKPRGCIDDNDTATDPAQGEDVCANSANGLNKVSALAITRDGKSLYATAETDDAVTRFARVTP